MWAISALIHACTRELIGSVRRAGSGCRFWKNTLETNGRGTTWQKARTVKFLAGSALTQPIASSHVRATCASEAFTITPAISKEWLEEPARMRTTPQIGRAHV